ncbi:PTS system IID component, Man family [Coriobacterium glomerans PW2]|uniref:PTS system IID component, Man family n=1 Tax=Coriobacterium glomerans (strain ATCC 49209 / DSM 20642 / JCM 10262 / PW2) TaxID=700015 RepID=F2NAX0_CORGP|nr:PTS system mannose/fructose/sorbose family transporter subunit IID [Coriobacterium glomerans]AEB07648.1 PTS system IID component, Man family [Coriobacterium glomerans PW2]
MVTGRDPEDKEQNQTTEGFNQKATQETIKQVLNSESVPAITKIDLLKAWWKWCLAVEVPVSFDRMQALAFGYSMNKIIRKLYKNDPKELKEAFHRHTSMFNTNCDWGSVIHGIVISLEEQRAHGAEGISPEMIQSIKLGLMGPLAGIGDAVDQGIVGTIPLAIFVPMALQGNIIAAFIPSLIYLAWSTGWSWFLFRQGYTLGRGAVTEILHSGTIKKVIDAASIMAIFMIGCLSASYVKVSTVLQFDSGGGKFTTVQSILDGILPCLLPFCVVMGMYLYITKRGPKYLNLIAYTMVIAICLTGLGII